MFSFCFSSSRLLYLSNSGRVDIRQQLLCALDEQGVERAGVVSVFLLFEKEEVREREEEVETENN